MKTRLEKTKKCKKNNTNGITLIALVVTIVVLLILAGITINMLFSENGIITKAKEAAEKTAEAEKSETAGMQNMADQVDSIINELNSDGTDDGLKIVDITGLKATITQNDEEEFWSTTLTLAVEPDENLNLTIEQKREIFANITGFSSFSLLKEYIETETQMKYEEIFASIDGMNENQCLDMVIYQYRDIIDYKNIEQLENAGLGVFRITDPQGKIIYMTNLGGKATCGVTENGNHTFLLKSGKYINEQSTQVSSIRSKDVTVPHEVIIDASIGMGLEEDHILMYSIDGSDDWQYIDKEKIVINCNNSISIKSNEESTLVPIPYQYTNYAKLDKEFYKVWDNISDWAKYKNEKYFLVGIGLRAYLMVENGKSEARQEIIAPLIVGKADIDDLPASDMLELKEIIEGINAYAEILKTEQTDNGELADKLMKEYSPKIGTKIESIGNISNTGTKVFNITEDTYLHLSAVYCLTTDMYVEVLVWDDDKKKKVRKKKKIKDVTYEDELLVWDFDKGEFTTAKPLWIMKPQVTTKYNLLKFSDGSELKTIHQHRIFNKEAGKFTYPMTDETPIGTTTYTAEGKEVKLVSKEEIVVQEVEYINIITKYHMNLFANNILTSCRFSNLYEIKDMKYVKDDREIVEIEEYKDIPEEYYYGLRLGEQPKEINRENDVHHASDIIEHIKNVYINTAKEK